MHWQSFFKGSVFSLFLLFLSLTAASLAFQLFEERTIAVANEILEQKTLVAANPTYHFTAVLAATSSAIPQTKDDKIPDLNILLLGLDSRKCDRSARCDAIQMVSLVGQQNKIIITSVPRGTISKDGNIIANVCSIFGFETAQQEIEKLTGVRADYVARIGFSGVIGGLRLIGLPPSPTLQFLRDRKDYGIGDNQRTYNQGMFLRDMILTRTEQAKQLPEPLQYLGYRLVDTDLHFRTAQDIFLKIYDSGLWKNPENVVVQVAPKDYYQRPEIHFDEKTDTTDWTFADDPEYEAYQKEIVAYLEGVIVYKNPKIIETAVNQRLWLQVDNYNLRNQLHYELVKLYNQPMFIEDFNLEMEQLGERLRIE